MKRHTAVRFPPVSGYDIPRPGALAPAYGRPWDEVFYDAGALYPVPPGRTCLPPHPFEPARAKIVEDDPEIIGLYESAGWTHLGNFRKNFYVFATPKPDAQAHTDPQVLSYAPAAFSGRSCWEAQGWPSSIS